MKEEILESSKRKITHQAHGNSNKIYSWLIIRNDTVQDAVEWHIQSGKEKKICQVRILYPPKLFFKYKSEIKIFPEQQQL